MITKPEVSHPTPACPNPSDWSCYDGDATEVEVLNLLESLIYALKPRVIVETGCYKGFGTERLIAGVLKNGFGRVYTCDTGYDMVLHTVEKLKMYSHLMTTKIGTGVELINDIPAPIDFAFLDSGPDEIRCHELRAVLPKLAAEGVIAVHDVGQQHGLRAHFLRTVKELGLQYITFATPRGFALVRKWQLP